MLPIVIVIVSFIFSDRAATIANALGDRFGLDTAARSAVQLLFTSTEAKVTISWLAVVISLLSAFSLSRRLSRVYASIFGTPALKRQQTWRGLVWIVVQVILFISASFMRDVRRDNGLAVAIVATIGLLILWFAADFVALRLLVPAAVKGLVIASAVTSTIGRAGIALWASIYMPKSLTDQAAQYGPIGVTFAIFTYLLAGVLVYVCAPLVVTTWVAWREGRHAPSIAE